MRLDMQVRRASLRELAESYQRDSKKEKHLKEGKMLYMGRVFWFYRLSLLLCQLVITELWSENNLICLNATDVASGWVETEALRHRAQVWTFQALERIKQRLPFPLLGIDSDNDGAFINAHLIRYYEENKLTFTRSRPYKKNDNCYVEQKNYSVVRRLVGYLRYDTEEEKKLLEQIYSLSRLYYNFFLPNMKLIRKERRGSRVTKKHDLPKTPYQRLLESPEISLEQKNRLRQTYQELNVVKLKREIDRLKERLWRLQKTKGNCTYFRIDSYVRQ
jgi:hypothetical protein